MKFAIRDDDLNYFFTPEIVEKNLSEVWDICPVSMSVIPFVKGQWDKNTRLLDDVGNTGVTQDIIEFVKADSVIYPISENVALVEYIKNKIEEGKLYLTLHAIHHRNEDDILPEVFNNYAIGAEFYTNQDLTHKLINAIAYCESVFSQSIEIFTPPQNLYSKKAVLALQNTGLHICGYPYFNKRKIKETISILGFINFMKIISHRLLTRISGVGNVPYPERMILAGSVEIIDHQSLQPGTCIEQLYRSFDYAHKYSKHFVLSTHSYSLSSKMIGSEQTMKDVLIDLLNYARSKPGVQFVPLNSLFKASR